MFEFKMVIVVRKDLALSPGKMAAQACHGAVEAALSAKQAKSKWFKGWRNEGQKKVVLKVRSEDEIIELKEMAGREKLPYHMVVDAGQTEIPPGTVTCIAIGPAPDNLIDKVTGHLSMY